MWYFIHLLKKNYRIHIWVGGRINYVYFIITLFLRMNGNTLKSDSPTFFQFYFYFFFHVKWTKYTKWWGN